MAFNPETPQRGRAQETVQEMLAAQRDSHQLTDAQPTPQPPIPELAM
jgi:hypothetical protein